MLYYWKNILAMDYNNLNNFTTNLTLKKKNGHHSQFHFNFIVALFIYTDYCGIIINIYKY